MDIAQFDTSKNAEKGVKFTPKNPSTFADLDFTVTLAGTDSSHYRNALKSQIQAAQDKGKEAKDIDLDAREMQGVELLAECVLGWNGLVENGETVKYSKKKAIDILKRHKWLREQIDVFIAARTNFFPK